MMRLMGSSRSDLAGRIGQRIAAFCLVWRRDAQSHLPLLIILGGLPPAELPFTLRHGDLSGIDFCLAYCHDFCHTFLIGPGPLAQSVEQRTFNPWVVGSIPTGPTLALYYSTSSLTYRVRLLLDRCSADA